MPQQAGDPARQVLVAGQGPGEGLDSGEGPHQDARGLGRHHVRQQLAALPRLFQQAGADLAPAPEGSAAVEPLGLLVEREPRTGPDHRVGAQPVGVQDHGVHQLLDGALGAHRGQPAVLLADHPLRQILLGGEMEVERTAGHPRPGEDLADRRGPVAAFLEDPGRRGEDRLAGEDRPVLHRRPRSSVSDGPEGPIKTVQSESYRVRPRPGRPNTPHTPHRPRTPARPRPADPPAGKPEETG